MISKIKFVTIAILFITIQGTAQEESTPVVKTSNRQPLIFPDYTDVLIPPNIAPLNFKILEPMDEASLEIVADTGNPIQLKSQNGKFKIPMRTWKIMLDQNRGGSIRMEVKIRRGSEWLAFQPITNRISDKPIDPYLSYRLINPAFSLWTEMGLYQRDIETFKEKPILINRLTKDNCMNCHNFKNNDPDYMLMHLRGKPGCTLFQWNHEILKVNTATDFNRAGAYPSWHPDGRMIAFSVNALSMFFHAKGESRDVLDSNSDIVIYQIDKNMITTCRKISDPKRMETFPHWSPDGKFLYFCAANELNSYVGKRDGKKDLLWENIRYDLMRISYDDQTGAWGKLEKVLPAKKVNGSITIPRISPDGRFLVFTKTDYGNFPIYMESADLYVLNLQTGSIHALECNSDKTESYHTFSSNNNWFVFSSKRLDKLCARPYFSYLNDDGTATKPVLLPQEDPEFYESFIKTYNVPELMIRSVDVNPRMWAKTALKNDIIKATLDPAVQPQSMQTDEDDLYKQAPR